MPDLSTLMLFAAASLVLTATPGPDMLLIASRSISQGRGAGLLTYAGIAIGTYFHALAAALGLSKLLIAAPIAFEIVRWAGCCYMLYLAWKTCRSESTTFSLRPTLQMRPGRRIFIQGLVTDLLNPKMALFMLALLPQFLRPEAGSIAAQTLILATVLNTIGLLVNGGVILLSGYFHSKAASPTRLGKLPQYLLASVFAGLACRVALAGRN